MRGKERVEKARKRGAEAGGVERTLRTRNVMGRKARFLSLSDREN